MIRILIVDDNESIHNDFKKVLQGKNRDKLRNVEMALFGDDDPDFEIDEPSIEYKIDDAYQGEEAIEMVDRAADEGNPYAMIFMDVRMPPGMDGIQASARIWEKHPDVELIICTAHSDYSWGEMVKEIGASDKLQFLRKPFDMVTVQQMAMACVKKHESKQNEQRKLDQLRTENERRRTTQRNTRETLAQSLQQVREVRKFHSQLLAEAQGGTVVQVPKSQLLQLGDQLTQLEALIQQSNDTLTGG